MAWEWGHTPAAYDYAREYTENLPKETLLEILGEWQYHKQKMAIDEEEPGTSSLPEPSFELPDHFHQLTEDCLANVVWDYANEYRTCDNGGHRLWICPDGCHTAPAGHDEEE